MRHDHLVPLSTQAMEILRGLERMTGDGTYVFPSIRSDERCMSENTVSAALRSMGYPKEGRAYNRTAHLPGLKQMMQSNCTFAPGRPPPALYSAVMWSGVGEFGMARSGGI